MPITAKAQGKTFTFPDGTTPDQMGGAIDEFFANRMGADAGGISDFSLDEFNPAGEISPAIPEEPSQQTVLNLAKEFAAGVNRPVFQLIDAFGTDTVNAALNLAGSQKKIPGAMETFGAEKGEFAGEGLGTDIAAATGELATIGAGGGAVLRETAKRALPAVKATEGALTGAIRQLGQTTPAADIVAGGLSGAGQEVGREAFGETGAIVGGALAPVAGLAAGQGLLTLRSRLGARAKDLIDPESGLPIKSFQKALEKRDLTVGSIIDENIPALGANQSIDDYVDDLIIEKLRSGSKDKGLAALRLQTKPKGKSKDKGLAALRLQTKPKGKPEIIKDTLGRDAVRQGFRGGDVVAAKQANRATKKEMQRMLRMKRAILADSSKANEFRPLDVAGDHVFERFRFIRKRAHGLSKELNVASSALKGKTLNTANIENRVLSDLDKLGLEIPDDILRDTTKLAAHLKGRDAFRGSDISKDRTSQKIIKDVVDILNDSTADAFRAHRLKRQLDSMIDFRKKSATGLTESGRNFAKGVRATINETIRGVSPEYARINDDLSRALTTIDTLGDALPRKVDLFDDSANKAIGQELRKLHSNYSSRQDLTNAMRDVDETVRALGGDFNVKVTDLVDFNYTIDDRFGATARGSFLALSEQAAKQGIRSPKDFAREQIIEKAIAFITPSDEQALNTMQRILSRNN